MAALDSDAQRIRTPESRAKLPICNISSTPAGQLTCSINRTSLSFELPDALPGHGRVCLIKPSYQGLSADSQKRRPSCNKQTRAANRVVTIAMVNHVLDHRMIEVSGGKK